MNTKLVLAVLVLVLTISSVFSAPTVSGGKLQSSNLKANLKGGYGGYGGYDNGYGGYENGYGYGGYDNGRGYDYCDPYYDAYCDSYDYGYGGYGYESGYYTRR